MARFAAPSGPARRTARNQLMSEPATRSLNLQKARAPQHREARAAGLLGARRDRPSSRPAAGDLRAFEPPGAKRLVDIVGAAVLMVLFSPLGLLIAAAIKLDSPGPVIYSQERVGFNRRRHTRRRTMAAAHRNSRRSERRVLTAEGRPFMIYKFRTMVAHAEREAGPVWALKHDPRITRVGHILRATRLDELPQLWNVLRGNMSLVGPRPERPFFVHRFARHIPGYPSRLYTHPGITGLAQVEHSYDASEDDVRIKLTYDLTYIERYSLLSDLRILAKTVVVMITRKGAH